MNWALLLPELILAATLGAVLLADLFLPPARKSWLAGLTLAGAALALVGVVTTATGDFGNAFTHDGLARFLKVIILAALGLVVLSAWSFDRVWQRPWGEFLVLLLAAALGMMFMASGQELILLYVGLELATFPLVLLTAYRPADVKSAEGGLKYLILASLGSAVFLFGLSLVYAATGATHLADIGTTLATGQVGPLLLMGLLAILAGVGFKMALVPFHMWVPDAYEGAPTPVTAFLSVASKSAGFVLAIRLLVVAFPELRAEWSTVLAALAAITMTLGNFAAIPQSNMKRMLAYSSVAQAGYLIMGLVAFQVIGLSALLFYISAYLVTNLAAFGVIITVERATGSTEIEAYRGLAQRSPRLGLVLMLALLSLAGIPPLAGFTAKFYLFAAVYGQGYLWLVILAVLNSALSLYYYLRVIRAAYIEPPVSGAPALPVPWPLALVLTLTLTGILALGIYPAPWVNLSRAAVAAFF